MPDSYRANRQFERAMQAAREAFVERRETTDDEIRVLACSRRRQRVEYGTDAEAINAGARSSVLARIWHESKSTGCALILHPTVAAPDYMHGEIVRVPSHMTAEEWNRSRVEGQRNENLRRDRMTLEVCGMVLMAYIEGRDQYARRLAVAIGTDGLGASIMADDSVPSYTEMRNFLIGEYDARPVIAAAAALAQRAMHNRLHRRGIRGEYYGRAGVPDRGWL